MINFLSVYYVIKVTVAVSLSCRGSLQISPQVGEVWWLEVHVSVLQCQRWRQGEGEGIGRLHQGKASQQTSHWLHICQLFLPHERSSESIACVLLKLQASLAQCKWHCWCCLYELSLVEWGQGAVADGERQWLYHRVYWVGRGEFVAI